MRSSLKKPSLPGGPHQSYEAQTNLIQVSVTPFYLEEESSPEEAEYVWMYHIMIDNQRRESLKIVGTYWQLTDSYGRVEEIRGSSIGGEQPTIPAGQDYHYVNVVSLRTPSGLMTGAYHAMDRLGTSYEIAIPTISLDSPHQSKTIH